MIISRKKSAPTYRQAGADVFLKGKNYNIELNHVRPPLLFYRKVDAVYSLRS